MTNSTDLLPNGYQMLLGLYGYLLPTLLYVLWTTLALWDLGKRGDLRRGAVWCWTLALFLLPFIGPIAYLLAAGGQIPARLRITALGGGAGAYVLVLLLGMLSGVS
ncbi:MAG: PLDc N-terminal domain-containing protein [Steroidobacteraceae bacterium]